MNKKSNIQRLSLLLYLIIMTSVLMSCGGGGSGTLNPIPGENPGVPSVVELAPSSFIAQTNGFITFSAKVLDGNGKPISNQSVTFTNLSSIGVLQATTAITDSTGIARVNLSSTTPGFATVLAQVFTGGQVRDQKTVFFTQLDVLAVRLALDVDADNDLIYDEPSDLILYETPDDRTVKLRARVYNAGGVLLAGMTVKFDSERPYRVGTSYVGRDPNWPACGLPEGCWPPCSDGSDTCWIAFPLGTTVRTNTSGEAFAQVIVAAESLRNFTSNLNVFASADNGASNMKTLFISPVSISSITVKATPPVIPPSNLGTISTSTITAIAATNSNQAVPDGTTINFSLDSDCAAAGGEIDPFGRTGIVTKGDGTATVKFTAPPAIMTCTITASAGGVSSSVNVMVTTALTVFPNAMTLNEGSTGTFNIFGGIKPYTVISSNSHVTVSEITDTPTGGTFTVTIGAGFCTPVAPATTCAGTATILVRDAVGTSVTITLTINGI